MKKKLTPNQQFGLRVRELRLARGWSQEELGARCGIDRTYVSGVERGVRNPTLTVVAAIAVGLETPLRELFSASEGH
ncbi:helix-turn-helix domain-containing protein [Variovorax sp. Root318D1]|uniref:helix-turn-helix domain-containing protein n=1 Tax=Variovorax sp. Root318D1 TaxID=1736513 RepID=UPI0009E93A75|nr:helix-turn-helix transcriptional regulator [Variovorax sp. Root318D1]